jgi:hypothetical protein
MSAPPQSPTTSAHYSPASDISEGVADMPPGVGASKPPTPGPAPPLAPVPRPAEPSRPSALSCSPCRCACRVISATSRSSSAGSSSLHAERGQRAQRACFAFCFTRHTLKTCSSAAMLHCRTGVCRSGTP